MTVAEAYAVCRGIARREAKNFYWAFRVLPRAKSDAMCAVYAFMRRADDLCDDESRPALRRRRALMATWVSRWRASLAGQATAGEGEAVFVALGDAQRRYGIPQQLLEELLQGVTMDLQPRPAGMGGLQTYASFDELYLYCYLVASVVGLVCIRIFGYTDELAERYAEETGVAFQLTNILRDVKEDAERGRLYLPLEMLAEFGVSIEQVEGLAGGSVMRPEERALLATMGVRAEQYYRSSAKLMPLLNRDSRACDVGARNDLSPAVGPDCGEEDGGFPRTGERAWVGKGGDPWAGARDGVVEPGVAGMSGTRDVVVVGGGLAGLAATAALAEAGAAVTLLEWRPYVGGRAYSYEHPALGEVVDSQHVVLGCCTNVVELVGRAGVGEWIRWYDEMVFLGAGRSADLAEAGMAASADAPDGELSARAYAGAEG